MFPYTLATTIILGASVVAPAIAAPIVHQLDGGIDEALNVRSGFPVIKKPGAPTITKDGTTIAKESNLTNKLENSPLQFVKDVVTKTDNAASTANQPTSKSRRDVANV
ncbi:hypothetical protein DL96DRAFT_1628527 [Flagelloscypha sp. PMI_526]|nr:hypothetical protein DL96DRAFT_1628527 [Flagelloscypha sp. PMI_526]